MKKVESGTIFAIPLPKGRGYCYGKYLHLHEVTGSTFDSHLFKVYDCFTNKVDTDIEKIQKSELLYGHFMLAGKPRIRGLSWKIIGNEILDNDKFYPDFKQLRGTKWVLVRFYKSIDLCEIYDVNIKRVEHLERSTLRSELEIPERILMELFRKEGKDIEKELDFDGEDKEMLNTYEKMKGIPIYSKIPEKYRGRVLPEGVSLDIN